MANERLRAALLTKGVDAGSVASTLRVDPKTVERWIRGRTPHRRHRLALAAALHEDEVYLWPGGLPTGRQDDIARAEIIGVYPNRSMMGMDEWLEFFRRAKKSIGILVHAGGFLAENNRFLRLMRERAAKDVSVRILLGDPESPEILTRGLEERLGRGVEFKVRNAIVAYSPLMGVPGISFRIHRSTLHNSIYRADEEWLINTHIYGISAPHAPMLHLRRVPGAGLVNSYERSFEMVWDSSAELEEGALSQ